MLTEYKVILKGLERGWGVAKPVGDRLAYDLIFDIENYLCKIQVKSAWFDKRTGNYVIDTRRTKTNRRSMVRDRYQSSDFDFAIAYLSTMDICYVLPVDIFNSYASSIHFIEAEQRQRSAGSAKYREAWHLIEKRAVHRATDVRLPVKLGETSDEAIPSQTPIIARLGEV